MEELEMEKNKKSRFLFQIFNILLILIILLGAFGFIGAKQDFYGRYQYLSHKETFGD